MSTNILQVQRLGVDGQLTRRVDYLLMRKCIEALKPTGRISKSHRVKEKELGGQSVSIFIMMQRLYFGSSCRGASRGVLQQLVNSGVPLRLLLKYVGHLISCVIKLITPTGTSNRTEQRAKCCECATGSPGSCRRS